jgi:hypothetical protein
MYMSLRNRLVVPVIFSALALLAGCGSSSPNIIPPPTGGFTNSNLNGTYVFSVSGYDSVGDPYAIVGTLTANGTGGITGGALDMNDTGATPASNVAVGSSSYKVGADGRGTVTLNASTPFGSSITLDFVLQDSSHGLVTEFDGNASGSGTLDVQTSGTTPTGSYAFSLFGNGDFATVGDFTVGSGGSISGLEDFNSAGAIYPDLTLSGTLAVGPSSTPSTTFTAGSFGLTFDVFAIDATHLKFIEMDSGSELEGDAYSQTSTSMPVGTLPFTLSGSLAGGSTPFVAGGFIVTDASNDINSTSSEDYNLNGTSVTTQSVAFSGTYTAAGSGRYTLSTPSPFVGGSEFAAYPSSAGVFLLEIDGSLGSLSGIAYPAQSSTTFATGQGYGLNLTGDNVGVGGAEVDDIAEFTAASSGAITGYVDENSGVNGPTGNISLGTTSSFQDLGGGRGEIGTGANSINTLNGGFLLTYYTVDGTTVPFIESDSGQVALGVMLEQDASSSAAAIAKAGVKHLYVPPQRTKNRKAQSKQK